MKRKKLRFVEGDELYTAPTSGFETNFKETNTSGDVKTGILNVSCQRVERTLASWEALFSVGGIGQNFIAIVKVLLGKKSRELLV